MFAVGETAIVSHSGLTYNENIFEDIYVKNISANEIIVTTDGILMRGAQNT